MKPLKIAIVGAGIGGLASALYLHGQGHRVRIFDQFDAPRPVGSGLLLQETGAAVLHDLGLWPKLEPLLSPIEAIEGKLAYSEHKVLDVTFGSAGFRAWGTHRGSIFSALFEAAREKGIKVTLNARVEEVLQSPNSTSLRFSGQDIPDQFDLVIDASGGFSKISAAGQTARAPLTFGALFATVEERGVARGLLEQRYVGAHTMIGLMPVGQSPDSQTGQATFFFSLRLQDYADLKSRGFEAFYDRVLIIWPELKPIVAQMDGFDDLVLARYTHQTLRPPFLDRLVHVGDSAHATSPQLGQGANMALLDAKALALAMEEEANVQAALRFYWRKRRFHVTVFQSLSWMFTPFYQSDSRVLPWLRDDVLAFLMRVPPVGWLLAHMVSGMLGGPLRKLGLDRAPK